jgi:hypothetical protein
MYGFSFVYLVHCLDNAQHLERVVANENMEMWIRGDKNVDIKEWHAIYDAFIEINERPTTHFVSLTRTTYSFYRKI